jgi:flagellar biosynthesis GTPase FlhF
VKKLEAEKARQKERERLLKEEEERLRREEQERQEKEEADRVKKLAAEKAQQEERERKRKEEEERLKKEAEKKLRQEQEEKKRHDYEAKIRFRQQQEKNQRIADQNRDKIISQTQTENAYQLFDMCPFVIAQYGKGLSFAGFGETKNKSQHGCCMKEYCRLWTYRTAENGEIYAQGCSLQFLGLNEEEIKKNFSIKNTRILQEKSPLKDEKYNPEEQG